MKRTRQQIQEEMARLQEELDATPKYDWDNMDDEDLKKVFRAKDWNFWENCPIGSLTNGEPEDLMLATMGLLTALATTGRWMSFIHTLRSIVRMRMEELDI